MKKGKSKWHRSFICLLAYLLCVAIQVEAQEDIKSKTVTLNYQSASLKTILESIRKQTGINFIYSTEQTESVELISIEVKQERLDNVLTMILRNSDLEYEIKGKIVTIIQKTKPSTVKVTSVQPLKQLQGIVSDEDGNTLPGVNVLIKETNIGTSTDINGRYTLDMPDMENIILEFRFIGLETKSIPYQGQAILNVEMKESTTELGEVKIISSGLFMRRAESFTGAASTYSQESLRSAGNQNLIKSLGNLEPSFVIFDNYMNGSNPNAFNDISIRGNSSFAGLQSEYDGNPNEPLFIVDGFESTREQVFDLDINRVSYITILKDAAAKAIYGSKAANGVVVIETVEPEKGRLRLTYTGDLSVESPDLSSYNLSNAAEKLQIEWNAGRYTSTNPRYTQELSEQYNALKKNIAEGVDTYWLSKPLRTSVGQKHAIYMEGGDERMRYSVSANYNNIEGVMKGSGRRTLAGNIKLSYRYKDLQFRNSLSITSNKADDSPYGSFSDYASANPYYAPFEVNGNIQKVLGFFLHPRSGATRYYYYNPLYNASIGTKNFSSYMEYTENFYIEWKAMENLRITGRLGYTHQTNSREDFYPGNHTRFNEWTGDNFFKRGSYTINDGTSNNISVDITANYAKNLGKNLLIANGAWSMNATESDSHGMSAWGFLNNYVDHISFARQYAENGKPSGSDSSTRSLGWTGAINYSYDDRYLADISIRLNGSSIFGADNRWGTFWSAGVGWNLHHEDFIKDLKVVNMFKLRASYGLTGSQNFNPYQAKATYKYYEDVVYDNIVGTYLMAMANRNLKWQQTADFNIGFDAQLFRSLNVRFDAYNSTTKDALLSLTLPSSSGFNSYQENLGNVENKGLEAVVNWRFFQQGNSYASLNFSVGHNTNKITKINDALKAFNKDQDSEVTVSPVLRYEEGQSMSAIWAVPSLGIDPANGQELYRKKDGTTTYTWSTDDYIVAGDRNPKVHGNFGLSGEYKGIGMNCTFIYRLGGDYYNQTLVDRVENVDIAHNVDRRVLKDTWQKPGDIAKFKKISATPSKTQPTTRFIEKNNELQLATVSCYYDFRDRAWLKNSFLERLRVSFFVNDLFRISTVKTERGLDYPYSRSFSFSVTSTF